MLILLLIIPGVLATIFFIISIVLAIAGLGNAVWFCLGGIILVIVQYFLLQGKIGL